MKFIFSFLFGITFSFSAFAITCSTDSSNLSGCVAGCFYDEFASTPGCAPCNAGTYNNGTFTDGCHPCAAQNSDNTWTWSITPPTANSIYDVANATTGQSECPWKCDTGYYKSNDGTACVACPDGNHFIEDQNPQQNISQCSCSDGKHLIYTTFTNSNNETMYKYFCGYCYDQNADSVGGLVNTDSDGITTCSCGVINANTNNSPSSQMCACPSNATFNSTTNQCECQSGPYMTIEGGLYICKSCPTYSSAPAGSDDINDCECDNDHPTRTEENGVLVSCGDCVAGAEKVEIGVNSNGPIYACRCKEDYYGDGTSCTPCPQNSHNPAHTQNAQCTCDDNCYGYNATTGCTRCPPGTILDSNDACLMSSATKFCTGSGDNKVCMQLIPSDATITQPSSN